MTLKLIRKKGIEEHETAEHVPIEQEVENNFQSDEETDNDGEEYVLSLDETLNRVITHLDKEKHGKIVRLKSDIPKLNEALGGGFENSRLYVFGGEPSMGKSLLVTQIALHVAKQGVPVLHVSTEMKNIDIGKRMAQMHAGVQCDKELDKEKLLQIKSDLKDTPLYISDGSMKIEDLYSLVHNIVSQFGVRLVIIDYFGRITGEKSNNYYEDVNDRMRAIDELAKLYNIPILVVVSLTIKQMYGRGGKRQPTVADIRDSGQFAYDCDYLIFIWKPVDYDPNYRELLIAKARFGPQGITIPITLDLNTLTFKGVEQEFAEEQEEKLPGTKGSKGLDNWRDKIGGAK